MSGEDAKSAEYARVIDEHSSGSLLDVLRALGAASCTGSLSVAEGGNSGVVFLEDGEVVDALVNDGSWVGEGIGAVAFLANLDFPFLSYSALSAFGKRTIDCDFERLQELVDQARPLLLPPQPKESKTDHAKPKAKRRKAKKSAPDLTGALPDPVATPFEEFIEQITLETADDASAGDERRNEGEAATSGGAPTMLTDHAGTGAETPFIQEETKMALDTYLQELKNINGYLAAGIMTFTGEMLASDTADPKIELEMVGAMFNDIFRTAHEASKKIGLQACKETIITTPLGTIVMRCSGVDAKAHVHIVSILRADGNQALMKMQIDKMVPAIIDELG